MAVFSLVGALGTAGPATADAPYYGVDVSNWQGAVDWAQVAASGHIFAFTKATEGVTFVDRTLSRNRQGMAASGMVLRGLYHFAHPQRNTPGEEAAHFLSTVGQLMPGEVPVLDLEVEGGPGAGPWAAEWMSLVEQATGRMPILYSGAYYLNDTPTQDLTKYPLWVAAWGRNDGSMPTRQPSIDRWDHWSFWQYTSVASVPGVSGASDRSVFAGSIENLAALTKPRAALPAPGPDPLDPALRKVLDDLQNQLRSGVSSALTGH